MDKLREEFEAWLKTDHLFTPNELEWQPERNCYAIYGVHLAWCAWQASRAALVVELPEEMFSANLAYDEGHAQGVFDMKNNVLSAGISIKGD